MLFFLFDPTLFQLQNKGLKLGKVELQLFEATGTQGDQLILDLMSYHIICISKNILYILPHFIRWCQSIKMESEVSWNAQTQKTIGLIPLVVPVYFLCSCIGVCLNFHSNPVETCHSQQYLHLIFPLKEIEWSQDDLLILVHSSVVVPSSQQNALLVNDVEPTITIWKEIYRSTKALIPCGNWTQYIKQLHSQNC